ncbi:MAG: choice-of-anchor J domain-containing protein [Muribaculaceae bacterium]|nr:choice-of-anchor J domain-containing protein [Muribaculaceae bacterium]
MKKLFYSLVLCVLAAMPAFAQETLTVYDGDATNEYVPVYGWYADAFNKMEMIMPAADLEEMTGGVLSKMTWYISTPAEAVWGGNFQVYLMEVSANAPGAEFTDLSQATLVFEGPLDGTGETLEIEFANDFTYEGGNLLIAVYQVEKGTYKRAYFAGTEVAGAAISGYSYSSLEAITAGTARNFLPKTDFEYVPGGGPIYYKPKNLQVSEIGTNGATLTWEAGADETSWGVEYKKAADEDWTAAGTVTEKTFVFDALENGVKYDVRVKSIYADGESGWVTTSFATVACEESDMGEVEFHLWDSYGDGWNGNKLQIYLAGTDVLIAELTIPHETTERVDYELEGTVKLCYGVDYDLVWVQGSYAYECSYELIGPEGETIAEHQGTGSSSGPVPTPGVLTTFQIHMNTCPRPTDVVAENITYNSATISWIPGTDEQDLFELVYAKGEFDPDGIDMVPVQVNDPFCNLTELEENSHYSVYVRSVCTADDHSRWSKVCTFDTPLQFPLPEGLAVSDITCKSAVASWTGEAETYNFRYRPKTGLDESFEYVGEELPDGWIPAGMTNNDADGDGNAWRVLKITDWNMGGTPLTAAAGDYCIVSESRTIADGSYVTGDNWIISSKTELSGTLKVSAADLGADYAESFSVMVSTTNNDPASFVELATENTPGALNTWQNYEYDLSAFEGQEGYVAIRHQPNGTTGYILLIDEFKIVSEAAGAEWINVENTTSPVTMEGLTPGTTYECQVQGIFEGKATSQWTDIVNFTTTAADAMPAAVTVDNITATTADVNVTGSQDTYNIRYRKAAIVNGVAEDFTGYETGDCPTGWTLIDADGDGQNWYVWNLTLDDGSTQVTFSSNSYINNYGPLTPDNWAITPQMTLGSEVSFDAWGQDPSYAAEHFQVYVSTTGTAVEDFTPISEELIATGEQTNYVFDLGPYEGETGYIAIRHFNVTDQYILNITNFYVSGDADVPAGEWITVENVEVPYTIEGLDPETKYEVQVQGIYEAKATTEWTNSVFFTTLAQEAGMDEFYVVGTFNDWNQEEEGGRIALVEGDEGVYTGEVELEADAEFKIITPAVDGGWIWFGGVDDNQVGYFLVNEELLDNPISLIDGANFRIYEAGKYTISVMEPRAINEPLVMVVSKVVTGIDNIAVDSQSNEWYNLNGQKLNGKPTTPGIYINGGKKVIVR